MPNDKLTMSRAAPPQKEPPSTGHRGRKTETQTRNYSEAVDFATFPFRRDGFWHELLEQSGPVCLVERFKNDRSRLHFEVVVFQKRKARILPNGDFLPEGWVYPASQQWGESGWTYADFAQARCRYLTLASKRGGRACGHINIAGTEKKGPYAEHRRAA
jgi:hypothetical protein